MADEKAPRTDDGKGPPEGADQKTTSEKPYDGRQLPGGSHDAAKVPVGMNALDKDEMPSGAEATGQARHGETPTRRDIS